MSQVAVALCRIVKERPGIHFRSLAREARLSSVGQLRHHLDRLERKGVIIELEDGRFKRFFASRDHDATLRRGLARFARRVPRLIGKALLDGPMNRTELRRSLACADSTLGYHLNRMVAAGDLGRTRGSNCCLYFLTDPDFVRQVLLASGAGPVAAPDTVNIGSPAHPLAPGPLAPPPGPMPAPPGDGPAPFVAAAPAPNATEPPGHATPVEGASPTAPHSLTAPSAES